MTFHHALAKFARLHPQYATPEGAKGCCILASSQFIDMLCEHGFLDPDCRCDEWEVLEYTVINDVSHYAARVGFVLVDWTLRQFDPEADWPKLITDPASWSIVS